MRRIKITLVAALAGFVLTVVPGCNDVPESGTQVQPNKETASQQKNAMEQFYKSQSKTAKAFPTPAEWRKDRPTTRPPRGPAADLPSLWTRRGHAFVRPNPAIPSFSFLRSSSPANL